METLQKPKTKFTRSITFKGMVVAAMTFAMLIPGCMVQEFVRERQQTRNEAVQKIDAKWSYAQTVSGPVLSIPYSRTTLTDDGKKVVTEHILNMTPERLDIRTQLFPEERYYGIYKTILYESRIAMSGSFLPVDAGILPDGEMHWERARLRFGVSDLRGISENIKFGVNDEEYKVQASGEKDRLISEVLFIALEGFAAGTALDFECDIDLKGSGSINFLPIGRTTSVSVEGAWPDPGFIGNYTPDYTLGEEGFKASWQVLHYNRSIPDTWTGQSPDGEMSFGVSLVETVDIYQQNMRSAKYALMFIALTFVVFFFVEIIARKRIHPVQYLLVGVALILFYSLLLSISEPLGFGWAYLISSVATIGLITGYSATIFRNHRQTLVLAAILSALYVFLYVILQLEQVALLAGSVGLFLILGIIMYFARKINWYGEEN